MTGENMKQYDFIDLAAQKGLDLIETTSERSGYPLDLKKAIIGFASFEEANELAQEHGLSIEVFQRRDGWNVWYRTGNRAYDPFTRTAEDYGDDYNLFTAGDAADYYENEVDDAICALEDNEAVVTYQGSLYEKIKKHSMGYYFDTHYYAIGLIDWNNED